MDVVSSRASSAVAATALALVFSFIITAGIIAALLARVDNSAGDVTAMLANPGFLETRQESSLVVSEGSIYRRVRLLLELSRGSLDRSRPCFRTEPGELETLGWARDGEPGAFFSCLANGSPIGE